jgi:exodeoxyribonuclease V alpha subunit
MANTEFLELPLTGLDKAFAKFLEEAQPSLDNRHSLLAAMASHQFGRGHACLDLDLLGTQGVSALGWDQRTQSLLPVDLSASAQTLPWIAGVNSPLVLDGSRLYLRRNWSAEQSIAAAIGARLQQSCPVPDNLAESLDLLFPASASTEGVVTQEPDWQKLACALATRERLTLITGGPGTGKTTTVVRLLAVLQSDATRRGAPLRIALAAPTGKAAARLGESIAGAVKLLPKTMQENIPDKAVTLHKLLQIRPNQGNDITSELAIDLVIVDEASMIDLEMMAKLLAAAPLTASLILLGDKDQLASVEAGAVMGQLCEGAVSGNYTPQTIAWVQQLTGSDLSPWAGNGSALAQQTVMLRLSHRFSEDSGIGLWAKAVNAGDTATVQNLWREAPTWAHDSKASVDRLQLQHSNDRNLIALVRQGWEPYLSEIQHAKQGVCSDEQALKVLKAFSQFQVLCAVRDGPWGVVALNRLIASALGFQDDGWYAGRPVMVNRNDYNLKLMNGDVGLCLPHVNGLRVAFPDGSGGIHWVLPSRLDAVESVFTMTVHKSQGSEFDHVCLVLPDQSVAVLTRELLYTGITRAKTRLSLVVPRGEVLWRAVDMKVLRSGGLMTIHQC